MALAKPALAGVVSLGCMFGAPGGGAEVEEAWVALFAQGDCKTSALAVDGSGNVHVTASSGACVMDSCNGVYTTLKFGAAGERLWSATHDGFDPGSDVPSALAVDGAGNVLVTGGAILCSGDYRTCRDNPREGTYGTVKYDRNGAELWVARYGGPRQRDSFADALALDPSGNAYVTGSAEGLFATVKYAANGDELWAARDQDSIEGYPAALALDAAGNVHVTGASGGAYVTVKYAGDGSTLWMARTEGKDPPAALAVDASGNVHVAGTRNPETQASGDFYDAVVVKLDAGGTELWTARYDGPDSRNDFPAAMTLDAAGNIYLAGWSQNEDYKTDFFTVKLAPGGERLWSRTYDGPARDSDAARALAVDRLGAVYVTGASVGIGGNADFATVKYGADGVEAWVERYDGPGGLQDDATEIAVDAAGNVYVAGSSRSEGTTSECVVVKYAPAGSEARFRRGDANGDGRVGGDVTDAVYLLNFNFTGGPEPPCLAAGDANGDGEVVGLVTDAVYLLTFSFLGGPPPSAPFPDCGAVQSPADQSLGCRQRPTGCP